MRYLKKVLVLLILLLFYSKAYALENKLYFKEDGDKLFYDESLIKSDIFMNHKEFVPGKTYTDKLIIKNGARKDYTLYFKILPKSQSAMEDKLLSNLNLKVYINNKLIYDGNIKGKNYNDISNAVELIKLKPREKINFKSEITLNSNYEDIGNYDSIYSDWSIYAYNNKLIEIIPKKTEYSIFPFIILIVLIILIVIIYKFKKRKKKEETNLENGI